MSNVRTTGLTTVIEFHGHRISRWVMGWSYPRNGNVHNPTPRVEWMTCDGVHHERLVDAKQWIIEDNCEGHS